ncbi:uncharacterized protein IUM83_11510 [Phytophthora cinnamomi]|nr:hypothetical protein IUM83_11510 [Phytophthora cinnamomi]
MDWTHGTNNLGYHLGNLVVMSATGRGIPVLDFLALDQKDGTVERILEFFKRHNPSWSCVQTFSIGKGFMEWCHSENGWKMHLANSSTVTQRGATNVGVDNPARCSITGSNTALV